MDQSGGPNDVFFFFSYFYSFFFFSHQRMSQRTERTSLEKQSDPLDPIASRGGSVSVFLRKPIAICDFPGGLDPHPTPSASAHAHCSTY